MEKSKEYLSLNQVTLGKEKRCRACLSREIANPWSCSTCQHSKTKDDVSKKRIKLGKNKQCKQSMKSESTYK